MKHIIAIVFMFLSINTSFAQQSKKTQKAVIKTTITCDHCKECETCGQLFNQKLLREKGVQMVTLDTEKMTIEVIYNAKKTTLENIKTAISNLGYDADNLKANPQAYEKLDGCCKV
ncbi:cation transporter [Flavobacterium sp. SM15]|uniref:heavy-metal-associated domain-containing protein n=1 Tax=Flavobacterium sp. SM15 TaxID=2908005 RepID=UPI001EDB5896|nr:cation transporter [Flavobacterium sp. SM15]MCG2611152.1 cation transporter [Flavobacterium sp. SM15]